VHVQAPTVPAGDLFPLLFFLSFFFFFFLERQLVNLQAQMVLAGDTFSLFFSFSCFSFYERQLVNLQAPMVLAGDLNLAVPFATATSLGSPCKRGLCAQRVCCVRT
jgi:hypothetical protein